MVRHWLVAEQGLRCKSLSRSYLALSLKWGEPDKQGYHGVQTQGAIPCHLLTSLRSVLMFHLQQSCVGSGSSATWYWLTCHSATTSQPPYLYNKMQRERGGAESVSSCPSLWSARFREHSLLAPGLWMGMGSPLPGTRRQRHQDKHFWDSVLDRQRDVLRQQTWLCPHAFSARRELEKGRHGGKQPSFPPGGSRGGRCAWVTPRWPS